MANTAFAEARANELLNAMVAHVYEDENNMDVPKAIDTLIQIGFKRDEIVGMGFDSSDVWERWKEFYDIH